ncbi:MAG: hypothetical protein KZQ91_03345 [Candidatus Thiodiazotropha sp. (ex Lucinoma borealis)]|nr:hypothetical protein [Candidatus Thiodiazotropha sp. (ex Lucinoma borealis)]
MQRLGGGLFLKYMYNPGFVIEILDISREKFRYWRRELDSRPYRPRFSFQMLLAYAVIQELVDNRWLSPRHLKATNLEDLFAWFEIDHAESERADMIIELDREQTTIQIKRRSVTYQPPRSDTRIETVHLCDLESRIVNRFKYIH